MSQQPQHVCHYDDEDDYCCSADIFIYRLHFVMFIEYYYQAIQLVMGTVAKVFGLGVTGPHS